MARILHKVFKNIKQLRMYTFTLLGTLRYIISISLLSLSLLLLVGCGVESTTDQGVTDPDIDDPIIDDEPTPEPTITPSPTPDISRTPTPNPTATPTPDDSADIRKGRNIYRNICSDCHAAGQGAGKSASELRAVMRLPQHNGGFGLTRDDLVALSKFLNN